MISVVIATSNAGQTLPQALSALVPAAVTHLVREVVIADAGSTDETHEIVDDAGARLVTGGLAEGCAAAKGPWLLILSPDVRLMPEWEAAARDHIEHHAGEAGWFRLALDDHRASARLKEAMAAFGAGGREGLLLSKRLFDTTGGDPATLAKRLGSKLRPLAARAVRLSPS
jgi:glycosyltransferase involved in cell wall biosynthesis